MLGSRLKNEIADLILSGRLKPGQRLDEQGLAARFGVSRTPVREALQQLGAAGLVEVRPRRSARVRTLSMSELENSFEAMGEIEAVCARLAAERMTEAERLALRQLVEESQSASLQGDRLASRELDARIHALLHVGAHNPALRTVADEMRTRVELYSSAPYTLPDFDTRLEVPHREHERIVEAVLDRDPAAAQRLMVAHIGQSFLTVKGILEAEASALALAPAEPPGRAMSARSVAARQRARPAARSAAPSGQGGA
mgnify:CR=1 FL=1